MKQANKSDLIRGHRRESVYLTESELQDLRARQRTFEGAYWRTSLAAFSTGLLILKVFTREFYKIGITFFAFGLALLAIALWRRRTAGDVFDLTIPFRTSGNWIILTTLVTLVAYIVLFVLLINV
ncbi:hypothetical protein DM01DRAFT_1326156 [Hesseltinella vesiculosa]|uniref:Uncharacterized protein n=1 Tax=Hesseltinella vesiculosa TaxID=101127 RepID=A0A1X2GA70_9FUNG|nr:hypothetical protein DM01DRAFT_1326156 [Hesseltinella vesiculosa]